MEPNTSKLKIDTRLFRASRGDKRNTTISFRATQKERETYENLAAQEYTSLAIFIRACLAQFIEQTYDVDPNEFIETEHS